MSWNFRNRISFKGKSEQKK